MITLEVFQPTKVPKSPQNLFLSLKEPSKAKFAENSLGFYVGSRSGKGANIRKIGRLPAILLKFRRLALILSLL
jgi:hypothetical protein